MSALPSARVLRRALGVVADLPPAALAAVIEAMVNKLDAIRADPDAEPDNDGEYDQDAACDCGDDDPVSSRPDFGTQHNGGPGDPVDGEPGEDAEPGPQDVPRHFRPGLLGVESWTGAGLA